MTSACVRELRYGADMRRFALDLNGGPGAGAENVRRVSKLGMLECGRMQGLLFGRRATSFSCGFRVLAGVVLVAFWEGNERRRLDSSW